MPDHKFWTHGVDAQIEYPHKVTDQSGNRPAHPQRAGWGTKVHQKGLPITDRNEDFNWFHFAIPTPTEIDDHKPVMIQAAYLNARIGPGAHLVEIHIREGAGNILHGEKPAGLTNKQINRTINFSRRKIHAPIVISVRVVFTTGAGSTPWVILEGAGGTFKEPRPGVSY